MLFSLHALPLMSHKSCKLIFSVPAQVKHMKYDTTMLNMSCKTDVFFFHQSGTYFRVCLQQQLHILLPLSVLQCETCCILLLQWLSGLWGVSKPFLPPKMGSQKKNSSLTAEPTTQPLVWHSDPGTPLLNTMSFKAKHLHPSLKGLFRVGHQATVR